ncbi:hypothetical protein SAMN05421595_2129 [Austwickia chelonae]|uniref:Uncharacterized protein n=1 Tax=Austwickia chelonae NBRC 105200 TaxID=1184607 RepID=K6V4F7_9MICO|nr:hypothetical protein [Austwickia chelonae]GAB76993.1 hypothetical protein AUCHE_04_00330 [Austwickia chelonae NBRC 105200]SEW33109.1 hypothetical protein SAMN05421595_2129 [Austwickia chelonae]
MKLHSAQRAEYPYWLERLGPGYGLRRCASVSANPAAWHNERMRTVSFKVNVVETSYGKHCEIMPSVDGVPLIELISDEQTYAPVVPSNYKLGSLRDHFMGRDASDSVTGVSLLWCECGEAGCCPSSPASK